MRRASPCLLLLLAACSAVVDVEGRTFAVVDAALPDAFRSSPDTRPSADARPDTVRPDAAPPPPPDAGPDAAPPDRAAPDTAPRDAAPPPDAPPPPPDAAPSPPDAAVPPPDPCDVCAAVECGEAARRCLGTAGCPETRRCVEGCDLDGDCRERCREAAPDAWHPYGALEACLQQHCAGADDCGAVGHGCGLTDAFAYDRGDDPCWDCHRLNCCDEGLSCGESVECLERVGCALACITNNPDCPGAQVCAALPGQALADAWFGCVAFCQPFCP